MSENVKDILRFLGALIVVAAIRSLAIIVVISLGYLGLALLPRVPILGIIIIAITVFIAKYIVPGLFGYFDR